LHAYCTLFRYFAAFCYVDGFYHYNVEEESCTKTPCALTSLTIRPSSYDRLHGVCKHAVVETHVGESGSYFDVRAGNIDEPGKVSQLDNTTVTFTGFLSATEPVFCFNLHCTARNKTGNDSDHANRILRLKVLTGGPVLKTGRITNVIVKRVGYWI